MKLWGKRFKKKMAEEALEFSASLHYDSRLYEYDIVGSTAHMVMLREKGIIPAEEANRILDALGEIWRELEAGEEPFASEVEDVHTEIERRLAEKVGDIAGKLHTARSRNDQVALDMRLYARDMCVKANSELIKLQMALVEQAKRHFKSETILPGYTHRQHAQPVMLAHHLLAHFEKMRRDRGRFVECWQRVGEIPLGAAALAGTSFDIDPKIVAERLKIDSVFANSMDAVSDRDFVLEIASAAAICMTHLSSLAGELVLWSSPEFGFVKLDDGWCTGSSIMPQKRNPDIAELVHAKSGRVFGHLMGLLAVMKGLPLTYNRDLQEDKEAFFDVIETLLASLGVMREMIKSAEFQAERMRAAADSSPFIAATEVADYLVRKGVAFREAHGVTAKIVQECEKKGVGLKDMKLEDWQRHSQLLEADVMEILEATAVVRAKKSPGGTAPERVREQLDRAQELMDKSQADVQY